MQTHLHEGDGVACAPRRPTVQNASTGQRMNVSPLQLDIKSHVSTITDLWRSSLQLKSSWMQLRKTCVRPKRQTKQEELTKFITNKHTQRRGDIKVAWHYSTQHHGPNRPLQRGSVPTSVERSLPQHGEFYRIPLVPHRVRRQQEDEGSNREQYQLHSGSNLPLCYHGDSDSSTGVDNGSC